MVRADQIAQLLESLVQSRIFRRGSEVTDGFRITPPFSDRGFTGVIGGVVVHIGNGANQVIGVTVPGHPHLLTRHELQGSVSAEVQHRIRAPNMFQIGIVSGKTVVRTGGTGKQ